MHLIQNQPTQAGYVPALTVPPLGWDGIEVSISDAACLMQILAPKGEPLDEILAQPGTLSLGKVGGVQFRTNPATPGLAAVIDAYASRPGEPVIGGLKARDQLPSIFGPTLFSGGVSVPAGAGLQPVFSSPVPGNWASLLLALDQPNVGEFWRYRADWSHAGAEIAPFDFYTLGVAGPFGLPNPRIAIPIIGDTLVFSARHNQGGPEGLTVRAYLSNFAPFTVWEISEWTLLFVANQAIGPSQILSYTLPLYAGPVAARGFFNGGGPYDVHLQGFDDTGTEISQPASQFGVAAGLNWVLDATLPPHKNQITIINNNAGAGGNVINLCIIGQRSG